jgi:hypothetical protein
MKPQVSSFKLQAATRTSKSAMLAACRLKLAAAF